MENKVKSLSIFLHELIANFTYQDFQPRIQETKIKRRLEEVIGVETPFWKTATMPEDWREYWFAIEVKSFKRWEPVKIGFCINESSIRINIFDRVSGTRFNNHFYESELEFMKIWLNHDELYSFLIKPIEKAILFANRDEHQDSLNWESPIQRRHT